MSDPEDLDAADREALRKVLTDRFRDKKFDQGPTS